MSSVTVEFDKEQGLALLTCMNYLFCSIQDLDLITDEQQKKDAELEFYRAIAGMQSISDEQMKSLFSKLEEIRIGLIKNGANEAADVSVVEVVDEPVTA